jgi:hypothetical protein
MAIAVPAELMVSLRPWVATGAYVDRLLRTLRYIDSVMVSSGGYPIADRWWTTLEEFYRSGLRRLVVRKGRRVGASTTVCPRLIVASLLCSEHEVAPGEVSVFGIVSVKRREAQDRLRNTRAVLDAMGLAWESYGEGIEVKGTNRIIRVLTASARTEVGQLVEFLWCDEVARWWSDAANANPASEVIGSITPATATVKQARIFLVSSPLADIDYHAKQFERGNTGDQRVAHFATWDVIPELTREKTRGLEPDERLWKREYGAIPSDAVTDNWFGLALEKAFVKDKPPELKRGMKPVFAIDAAFVSDNFGWAVVSTRPGPPDPVTGKTTRLTWLHASGAWKPDREPSAMAHRLRADVCARYAPDQKTPVVFADQYECHSFKEIARQAGIELRLQAWTGGYGENSKLARYRAVRLAMLEGSFLMQYDAELLREFRLVQGKITPSGSEQIYIPRDEKTQGHGDRVTAIVLAGSIALSMTPTAGHPEPLEPRTRAWHDMKHQQHREKLIAERSRRKRGL